MCCVWHPPHAAPVPMTAHCAPALLPRRPAAAADGHAAAQHHGLLHRLPHLLALPRAAGGCGGRLGMVGWGLGSMPLLWACMSSLGLIACTACRAAPAPPCRLRLAQATTLEQPPLFCAGLQGAGGAAGAAQLQADAQPAGRGAAPRRGRDCLSAHLARMGISKCRAQQLLHACPPQLVLPRPSPRSCCCSRSRRQASSTPVMSGPPSSSAASTGAAGGPCQLGRSWAQC